MDLQGWDQRYRSEDRSQERSAPAELIVEIASQLPPGRVLDLACGTGRHALWFAEHGWDVTAVDGSPTAIDIVQRKAAARKLTIDARVADLEKREFAIEPASWDLIVVWLYLHRDLMDAAKLGVKPGGVILASVLIANPGEESRPHRMRAGELTVSFRDWEILHDSQHSSTRGGRPHTAAEIAARRSPATSSPRP